MCPIEEKAKITAGRIGTSLYPARFPIRKLAEVSANCPGILFRNADVTNYILVNHPVQFVLDPDMRDRFRLQIHPA